MFFRGPFIFVLLRAVHPKHRFDGDLETRRPDAVDVGRFVVGGDHVREQQGLEWVAYGPSTRPPRIAFGPISRGIVADG
jgi:hypothetical protein